MNPTLASCINSIDNVIRLVEEGYYDDPKTKLMMCKLDLERRMSLIVERKRHLINNRRRTYLNYLYGLFSLKCGELNNVLLQLCVVRRKTANQLAKIDAYSDPQVAAIAEFTKDGLKTRNAFHKDV